MELITFEDAKKKYGAIEGGKWADEAMHCRKIEIPSDIAENWINSATGFPTTHIYCNRDVADAILCALQNVRDRKLIAELHSFDGCFQIRDVRAEPGKPSWHSYAMAIDINAKENPLGGDSKFSAAFVGCFKDAGFIWGGDFKRKDPQHFQLAKG